MSCKIRHNICNTPLLLQRGDPYTRPFISVQLWGIPHDPSESVQTYTFSYIPELSQDKQMLIHLHDSYLRPIRNDHLHIKQAIPVSSPLEKSVPKAAFPGVSTINTDNRIAILLFIFLLRICEINEKVLLDLIFKI